MEEVGEHASGQVGRNQNLVYTLPHTTESIAEFLTPALARVDPSAEGTQVVVATRDAETALAISETGLRLAGPAGIEVVPITSAARAGRIFKTRPVLAVAGTPAELLELVRSSLLKLDTVRTVVLAWADDILDEGPEVVIALEGVLSELSEAGRIIVARKLTPVVENLAERYARRARRVGVADSEAPQVPADYEMPIIKYVTVAGSARGSALRRLLDDLDPPSAMIVARDEAAAAEAARVLRTLGYHDDDESMTVTRGYVGNVPTHTVIFYQPPVTPGELQRVSQAKPVQVVVVAAPGEVPWLRELASGRLAPLNFHGPERRARNREEAVRQELRAVLARGVPARELVSLEPLLQEFDGTELAAAALHVLERERAQRRLAEVNQTPAARPKPSDGAGPRAGAAGMTRLFMTIGTRDGVKVGDLMGIIAGEGGIPGDRVGKIDLQESHALVEVAEADAAGVITRVNGSMIKGRRVVVRGERDREDRERAAGPRDRSDREGRSDRPVSRGERPDRGSRGDRPRPPRRPGSSDRPTRGGSPPRRDRDRS
ncbi:MAG TPA: DbpA RNA binding domain-containing protein [Gemmatimonadaceae bacterium]|nr:DbpA RNA binding domain-containing protein [Gemmatimonadaceae bacterium]